MISPDGGCSHSLTKVCRKLQSVTWLANWGTYSSDEAKMTGMTPDWFTFSGM